MSHEQTIATVRASIHDAFTRLDCWFDREEELQQAHSATGGWSVEQVLEHISLTNHFLLLTLKKWTAIAERRAARGCKVEIGESDLQRLEAVGKRGSFGWNRPEHMEPKGATRLDVRRLLSRQRDECLALLDRLPHGVGALCRITMTVDQLGKIDLYQWLYFLTQHIERHLQQLAAIERDFRRRSNAAGHSTP